MARGATIQVEGIDKLIKKFGSIPENVKVEVDAEMARTANEFVNRAVDDAPVDQGIIKSELTFNRVAVMYWEVISGAEHSAWVEFGTRSKVQVPGELAAYASQFKNAGSSGDAKKQIYDWCKRVGIEEKFWYPVFRSIMTNGITPHPFFFSQLPIARQQLNQNLKQVVARAIK